MVNINSKYRQTVKALLDEIPFTPDVAIILGSGLGDLADKLQKVKSIPTVEIPNYPKSTVHGHKGFIHFAEYESKKILLFQGRIHFYEGYDISECLLPIYLIHRTGCEKVILTNAAGGVNPSFVPGDLMLIDAFYTFNIKKELSAFLGKISHEQKNSFLDFPSKKISDTIKKASLNSGVYLQHGSYWYGKGPTYETKAEIQMMLKLGIDAVGMSTAHEATYAKYLGMEVGGISLITNYAAGLSPTKLSHQEVIDTANEAKGRFEKLVKNTFSLL